MVERFFDQKKLAYLKQFPELAYIVERMERFESLDIQAQTFFQAGDFKSGKDMMNRANQVAGRLADWTDENPEVYLLLNQKIKEYKE